MSLAKSSLSQRITFLLLVFYLHLGPWILTPADANDAKVSNKPNVVFILADDLGYRELGSFGQEKIKTPNIDTLARDGMRLTQHYCGNAVCAPSRCVLLTGKHPGHAFVRNNRSTPPEGPMADS